MLASEVFDSGLGSMEADCVANVSEPSNGTGRVEYERCSEETWGGVEDDCRGGGEGPDGWVLHLGLSLCVSADCGAHRRTDIRSVGRELVSTGLRCVRLVQI
jgi:hypothetical protein